MLSFHFFNSSPFLDYSFYSISNLKTGVQIYNINFFLKNVVTEKMKNEDHELGLNL